jgi:hypothetical protein
MSAGRRRRRIGCSGAAEMNVGQLCPAICRHVMDTLIGIDWALGAAMRGRGELS